MEFHVGDRIYYTGDMANIEAWCTVDCSGPTNVGMTAEDGRVFNIPPWHIGREYKGDCNPRFVTRAAYDAYHDLFAGYYNTKTGEAFDAKVAAFKENPNAKHEAALHLAMRVYQTQVTATEPAEKKLLWPPVEMDGVLGRIQGPDADILAIAYPESEDWTRVDPEEPDIRN